MHDPQPRDPSVPDPPSAGARYRAHLSRYPERSCEPPPPPRWLRELLRALRMLAGWSGRRRRYEGR
jgi:hypothetical protein